MTKSKSIKGLYAVTPDLADTNKLCSMVVASLRGGVSLIQYRNKSARQELRLEQASTLLDICRKHGKPLIINDHLDLCVQLDADGIHLGGEDGNLAQARTMLGRDKILGASCYNRLELALIAQSAGSDYVAFGRCFDSTTKPGSIYASLDLFSRARATLDIPIVAIGGITLENAQQVINAGADAIAVIGALFSASNIVAAAQQFSTHFADTEHHVQKPATL